MKKWLIVILLVMCPIVLRAECDYKKHTEYTDFAKRITYENEYSMGEQKFTVKFYNVISGLYFKIGKDQYEPDENDVLTLKGVAEGKKLEIYVYGKDGCPAQVHNINISLPYYNPYYGTEICKGYEQLTLCSSNFTPTKATKQMIEKTKATYDDIIIQDKDPKEEAKKNKKSMTEILWNFFVKYLSKILLVLLSSGLSIWYYNNKLMKVEHGI